VDGVGLDGGDQGVGSDEQVVRFVKPSDAGDAFADALAGLVVGEVERGRNVAE
jgi:hypothetical protein